MNTPPLSDSWPFPVLRFDDTPTDPTLNSRISALISHFANQAPPPEVAEKYVNLKRKLNVLSGRDPEKKNLKAVVKRMRTEHPSLALKPGLQFWFFESPQLNGESLLIPETVDDQKLQIEKNSEVQGGTEAQEKTENMTPITIGAGEKQIKLCISENEKTRLIFHSTFFQFLLGSTLVEFDTSPLELGSLNSDPEIVHSLIQHAISDKQIDITVVQKELRFQHLQKLYDAAYELQMSKYLEQIKKLSLMDCKETKGSREKYAKFKMIGEKMQPHSVLDLNELYFLGLTYPNLAKILRFGNQLPLDPSSDLYYMLSFMDQHREEHSIDQYKITAYGNRSNERANYFLKTLDYWLPRLKKLHIEFIVEEENGNDSVQLDSCINLNIGFFARLEEFTISGYHNFGWTIDNLDKYFPNLQKITVNFSSVDDLLIDLTSHPSLKTVVWQSKHVYQGEGSIQSLEGDVEYSRDDVSQPFEEKQ